MIARSLRIHFFLLLSVGMLSCEDSPQSLCRVIARKEIITGGGSVIDGTFTYNDQGQVIKWSCPVCSSDLTYEYMDGKMINRKDNGVVQISYEYNSGGQLIKETFHSGGSPNDQVNVFEYNASGQLILKVETSSNCPACTVISTTFAYSDDKSKNPSVVETTYSGDTDVWRLTYEYDDKPNPERMLFDLPYLPVNNITKIVFDSPPPLGTSTTIYKLEYNSQGLLIRNTLEGQGLPWGEIKEYQYSCPD